MKVNNWDIVRGFRDARARLRLGRYEAYLVERIAARVERLLRKRDKGERAGDAPGDVPEAGGRCRSTGRFVSFRSNRRDRRKTRSSSLPLTAESRAVGHGNKLLPH